MTHSYDRIRSFLLGIFALAALLCPALSLEATPLDDSIKQLQNLRDTMRQKLRDRSRKDAAVEAPRDVEIELDKGLVKRSPLRVLLRKQGGGWFVREVQGAPDNARVDVSDLKWEGDRITGPIVVRWGDDETTQSDAAAEADDEAEAETADQTGPTQRYRVDLHTTDSSERLVITMHRFHGGPWVLAYRKEGDKWVFDAVLEEPRIFSSRSTFKRDYGDIAPKADGSFSTTIKLTHVEPPEPDRARKGESRHHDSYEEFGHPVITFEGRLIDGRVSTSWKRTAAAGKGLMGSGQDMLTAAVRNASIHGRYRSEGNKGGWMGAAKGAIIPVPIDPVASVAADDVTKLPDSDAAKTRLAADIYREICALDMALRRFPLPLRDAIARVQTPRPIWQNADDKAMSAYVEGLVQYARRAAQPEQAPKPVIGNEQHAGETFGPYFGNANIPDDRIGNSLPKAGDGPQQWRAIGPWRMIGPFPVFDQEADVNFPEIIPVEAAKFERQRVFQAEGGTLTTNDEPAPWLDTQIDRGTVYAPRVKDAYAGVTRFVAWYAKAAVNSEVDQEVWLSMTLQGQAMLWVNGKLVWKSGTDFDSLTPVTFKVKLSKGDNQLLVRCATNAASIKRGGAIEWVEGWNYRPTGEIDFTHFALHACTQGSPDRDEPNTRAIPRTEEKSTAYRRDGSARYPDAKPPIAWDIDKGINIAWNTPLPHGSAEIVERNGRLFVMAEPDILICVDATNGRILWQKPVVPEGEKPDEIPVGKDGEPKMTARATVAPVATDEHVFAHVGSGAVACFTVDGQLVWATRTGSTWKQHNMGAPLLVDGKLIVQTHLDSKGPGQYALIAYDAKDGKKLWTATGPPKRTYTPHDRSEGLGNGVSVMTLSNGNQTRSILITGDGAVIDPQNGDLLHRDIISITLMRAPAIVEGDTIYCTPVMGEEAIRLWLDEAGRVGARTVWRNPPSSGRGQAKTTTDYGNFHWMKPPVIQGDLMYVVRVDKAHVPQHYPCAWTQLEIFDIDTGKRLFRRRALLRNADNPAVMPVIAGDYLYVADGGAPVAGFGGDTEFGKIAVLELQETPEDKRFETTMHTPTAQGAWGMAALASRNKAGRMRAAPVFRGERMFLRSFTALTCVAATSTAGKTYEMEQVASTTFGDLLGRKPEPLQRVKPTPLDEPPADGPAPVLSVGGAARQWLVLGPLPAKGKGKVDALASIGGHEKATPRAGQNIEVDDTKLIFRMTEESQFVQPGVLDLQLAMQGVRQAEGYVYAVLECRTRQTVRFDPSAPVVAAWIAGTPIKSGDELRLDVGYYPLLMKVQLSRVPSLAKAKLTLGFGRAAPVFDSPELWIDRVKRLQDRINTIAVKLRGTGYARTARLNLQQAGLPVPQAAQAPAAADSTDKTDKPSPAKAVDKPANPRPATIDSPGPSFMTIVGGVIGAVIVILVLLVIIRRTSGR